MQINKTYFDKLNKLGKQRTPFLFIIDFEQKKPVVYPLDELPENTRYLTPRFRSQETLKTDFPENIIFEKEIIPYSRYERAMGIVKHHIHYGDSYLLNLTMPTKLNTNLSLENIFDNSNSIYRLLFKNEFVCFSPEIFVKIEEGIISSYPMKGTIDASIPNAEEKLLNSKKEIAEHNTIVDLIRNDLSMVSKKVRVNRFRYIDRIKTRDKDLLQVSSEISGELENDYHKNIGTILSKLLPAGSICGAPKAKTVEVILNAENYERGYYTGIFGVFDGENMDSAVMIRYMEKSKDGFVFKSGGGVTALSDTREEFQELIDKVYVPFS